MIATVEKIWAEKIANSDGAEAVRDQPRRAVRPVRRRRGAEGGVAGGAGQRVVCCRHRQGQGRARHAGHPAPVAERDRRGRRPCGCRPFAAGSPRVPPPEYPSSPRRDLQGGIVWIALGCIVVVLSWQMDRMTQQGATMYTAPGLWPGIVGSAAGAAGRRAGAAVAAARARRSGWDARRGGRHRLRAAVELRASRPALFLVYALLLVGRGLPFWLGHRACSSRPSCYAVPVRAAPARRHARPRHRRRAGLRRRHRGRRDGRCSSSSSTCGCRSAADAPDRPRAMFDGLIAFGHSIWSFCEPAVARHHPAVVAGRHRHRRAARA